MLKIFLLSFVLAGSGVYGQAYNDRVILTQPSYTINNSNWNYLKSTLQPKLEQLYEFLAFSDQFNLEVEIHGAIKEPFYQLQRKSVTIEGIPDENGIDKDAVFFYAIGGYYVKGDQVNRIPDNEYLCKVRIDMPVNISSELIYRHNILPKTLMNDHAMHLDIMDLYTYIVLKNIREICHAGYWGEAEGVFFNSYNDVMEHFWKKIKKQVLEDSPELETMPKALSREIWERINLIERLLIVDPEIEQPSF